MPITATIAAPSLAGYGIPVDPPKPGWFHPKTEKGLSVTDVKLPTSKKPAFPSPMQYILYRSFMVILTCNKQRLPFFVLVTTIKKNRVNVVALARFDFCPQTTF